MKVVHCLLHIHAALLAPVALVAAAGLPEAPVHEGCPVHGPITTGDELSMLQMTVQVFAQASDELSKEAQGDEASEGSSKEDQGDELVLEDLLWKVQMESPWTQRREALMEEGDENSANFSAEHFCVMPGQVSTALKEHASMVERGLPAWTAPEVPSVVPTVTLAFLIQVSTFSLLPVVNRTLERIYSPQDLFLFFVDREMLGVEQVMAALPHPLPTNVLVRASSHAAYYVWPRVEIVLDGLRTLIQSEHGWDFAVHLSESDYPVHGMKWIRRSLASQRNTNFMELVGRCSADGETILSDWWYWWGQETALASCAYRVNVTPAEGVRFPLEDMEAHGIRFGHGTEWMIITRELVQYALSPELMPFRKVLGMHSAADEMFWQTLVLNIPNFTQNVSKQSDSKGSWFLQWGHGKTRHSPDILTKDSEETIEKNKLRYFFMRKVNSNESSQLLDDMDALSMDDNMTQLSIDTATQSWTDSIVVCPPGVKPTERAPGRWLSTSQRQRFLNLFKTYVINDGK